MEWEKPGGMVARFMGSLFRVFQFKGQHAQFVGVHFSPLPDILGEQVGMLPLHGVPMPMEGILPGFRTRPKEGAQCPKACRNTGLRASGASRQAGAQVCNVMFKLRGVDMANPLGGVPRNPMPGGNLDSR